MLLLLFKDEKLNEVRSKLLKQISGQQMKHAWLYSDLLQTEGESGEKEGSVHHHTPTFLKALNSYRNKFCFDSLSTTH